MKAFKYLFFVFSLVYLLYSFFTTDCAVTYEDKYTYNYKRDSIRWSTIMMYSDPEYKDFYLYTPFCDLSLNGKTYEQIIGLYGLPINYDSQLQYGAQYTQWVYKGAVLHVPENIDYSDILFVFPSKTEKVRDQEYWQVDSLRYLFATFITDSRGEDICKYAIILRKKSNSD